MRRTAPVVHSPALLSRLTNAPGKFPQNREFSRKDQGKMFSVCSYDGGAGSRSVEQKKAGAYCRSGRRAMMTRMVALVPSKILAHPHVAQVALDREILQIAIAAKLRRHRRP
jgi:hypothetical protein